MREATLLLMGKILSSPLKICAAIEAPKPGFIIRVSNFIALDLTLKVYLLKRMSLKCLLPTRICA